MKRYFLLFLSSVLIQTVCYAFEKYLPEGWIVDYRVCGKDTVFYKKKPSSVSTFCGLKGYEEDLFSIFHYENEMEFRELIDRINYDFENRIAFYEYVVRKVLEGYDEERRAAFIEASKKTSRNVQILICLDAKGLIFDLNFIYPENFEQYLTCEDIVRNTKVLKACEPFPFFKEYENMGVKILPPLLIPIDECLLELSLKDENCEK